MSLNLIGCSELMLFLANTQVSGHNVQVGSIERARTLFQVDHNILHFDGEPGPAEGFLLNVTNDDIWR